LVIVLLGLIFLTLIRTGNHHQWCNQLSVGPFLIQPSELIKPFWCYRALIFGQWNRIRWSVHLSCVNFALCFGDSVAVTWYNSTVRHDSLAGSAGRWVTIYLGELREWATSHTKYCLRDYQRRRVMSFLDPWADPRQDGYQLIQSLLAVGSGGRGTGFGRSQQVVLFTHSVLISSCRLCRRVWLY